MLPLICVLFVTARIVAAYQVPHPEIEVLKPRGFKLSIPAEDGIQFFEVHGHAKKLDGLEDRAIYDSVQDEENGKFTFYDKTLELKNGDVVHYWLFVLKDGISYQFDDIFVFNDTIADNIDTYKNSQGHKNSYLSENDSKELVDNGGGTNGLVENSDLSMFYGGGVHTPLSMHKDMRTGGGHFQAGWKHQNRRLKYLRRYRKKILKRWRGKKYGHRCNRHPKSRYNKHHKCRYNKHPCYKPYDAYPQVGLLDDGQGGANDISNENRHRLNKRDDYDEESSQEVYSDSDASVESRFGHHGYGGHQFNEIRRHKFREDFGPHFGYRPSFGNGFQRPKPYGHGRPAYRPYPLQYHGHNGYGHIYPDNGYQGYHHGHHGHPDCNHGNNGGDEYVTQPETTPKVATTTPNVEVTTPVPTTPEVTTFMTTAGPISISTDYQIDVRAGFAE